MDRFCPRFAPRRRSQFSRPRLLALIKTEVRGQRSNLTGHVAVDHWSRRRGIRGLIRAVQLLISLATFFSPQIATATDGSWNYDGNGFWSDSTKWFNNDIADGAGATANFTFNIGAPATIVLDSDRTIGILNIGDADGGSSYTIDSISGYSLIFDNSPNSANAQINISTSAGDTIAAPFILGSSLDITNSSLSSLTISGTITSNTSGTKTISLLSGNAVLSGIISDGIGGGNISIVQSNSGSTLTLSGARTYSGGTFVSSGTLALGASSVATSVNPKVIASSPVGKGVLIISGGTVRSDSTTARTILNNLQLSGNITFGDAINNGALTFSSTDLSNNKLSTAATVQLMGNPGLTILSPVTIVDVINDGGSNYSLTKDGAGQLTLSGLNTYTGGTIVNGGELTIGVNQKITNNVLVSSAVGTGTLTLNDGATLDSSKNP